jgi:hypothetical protein
MPIIPNRFIAPVAGAKKLIVDEAEKVQLLQSPLHLRQKDYAAIGHW